MKLSSVILLGILCILGASSCQRRYVEFTPLKLKEGPRNELIPAPELVSDGYVANVAQILQFYHEDFYFAPDGRLMIRSSLAADKELLWNYSTKAKDENFVSQLRK